MIDEIIKVICINNLTNGLKLHKLYDAKYIHEEGTWNCSKTDILEWDWYEVTNEVGEKAKYFCHNFITLSEWRDKQINSIFND